MTINLGDRVALTVGNLDRLGMAVGYTPGAERYDVRFDDSAEIEFGIPADRLTKVADRTNRPITLRELEQ